MTWVSELLGADWPCAKEDTWSMIALDELRDAAQRAEQHLPFLHLLLSSPNMAAAQESQFLKQASGPNTRGLLRVIILCLIAGAAVSSRLFSVIRFESIIHEC
jgi:hypothetical protein